MRSTWRRHLGAVAIVALGLVAAACSSGDPSSPASPSWSSSLSTTTPSTTTPSMSPARDRAAALAAGGTWAASQLPGIDVASSSMFAFLHRNWGLAEVSTAAPTATARIGAGELDPEELLLLRLVDGVAVAPEGPEPTERTTRVLSRALQCDRTPLDAEDLVALDGLIDGGGYDTTHAALAVGWLHELGCGAETWTSLRNRTVERLTDEFDPSGPVTDLALEQSATLLYLGAGEAVPEDWTVAVLAAQRDDGSWGDRAPSWHMTLLALWTLLAADGPGLGVPMVPIA